MIKRLMVLVSLAYCGISAASFPLKISENKRYLVDQDGTPFLINADTPWWIFTRLTLSEVDEYIADRLEKRFNAVQIVALSTNGDPAMRNGERPLHNYPDLSSVNDAYFDYCDKVLEKFEAAGIAVIVNPAWLGCCGSSYGGGWRDAIAASGTDGCRRYGEYLGTRWSRFKNIVMWLHGGDADPGGEFDEVAALAQGIIAKMPGRLHSAHCGTPHSTFDIDQYRNASWINVNATYTYYPDHNNIGPIHVYDRSKRDYERSPAVPFFLSESEYEWGNDLRTYARRQAWWSILCGSTGHVYSSDAFKFEGGWRESMDFDGARSMKFLSSFFASVDWWKLVPDFNHSAVTGGCGD
jgi:hypothetical protein